MPHSPWSSRESRATDEVNFWQPTSKPLATFLEPGVPFLFKLHAPANFVVGGGFFVRFSALPARVASEAFAENNGVPNYPALRRSVEQYRGMQIRGDPEIGCNVLNAPFFFDERDWIPIPENWARNIVRGKTYDTSGSVGHALWDQTAGRLPQASQAGVIAGETGRYGAEYLARARLGQGAFRVLATEAYHGRCAITGERTLPVLEAAHIRPYAESSPHHISNGILLREDLHALFDDGYITLSPSFRIEVSRRIREEFENGREYYAHHGQPLVAMPERTEERPSAEFLRWHDEQVYLG